jgi:hypothetical protein
VTIAGLSPAGYDGAFNITVVDATHFTYTAPAAGLVTATVGSGAIASSADIKTNQANDGYPGGSMAEGAPGARPGL